MWLFVVVWFIRGRVSFMVGATLSHTGNTQERQQRSAGDKAASQQTVNKQYAFAVLSIPLGSLGGAVKYGIYLGAVSHSGVPVGVTTARGTS